MKPQDTFTITHKVENGLPTIEIAPAKASAGYPPLKFVITQEQWDAMRFHFLTAVNDKEKITKLSYL